MPTVLIFVLLLANPAAVHAQGCLHGADETAQEKDRAWVAVTLVRQVNTGQATYFSRSGKYGTLDEIAGDVQKAYGPGSLLVARGSLSGLEGFEVGLTASADGYSVSVKDMRDPCRLAYFSDRAGVVFRAFPLDIRAIPSMPK